MIVMHKHMLCIHQSLLLKYIRCLDTLPLLPHKYYLHTLYMEMVIMITDYMALM